MATLYKRTRSPFYWTAFFAPDPAAEGAKKRRYVSTGERKRDKAKQAAADLERAANRVLDGEKARAVTAILGEVAQRAAQGLLTQDEARRAVDRMLGVSTGETVDVPKIADWLSQWAENKAKVGKAAATVAAYKTATRHFLAFLPADKHTAPLTFLRTSHFEKFRDAMRDEGRNVSTVNHFIKILRVPMNAAFKQGFIATNPAVACDTLTVDAKAAPEEHERTFTAADVSRLLKAAKGTDWQGAILIGYFTGARLRDVCDLTWANIHLQDSKIEFRARKTGKSIKMPMHEDLENWLLSLDTPDDSNAPLFPTLYGRGSGGHKGLSADFQAVMRRAKIDPRNRAADGEAGYTRAMLSFHSLRHSFNSALANAGVDSETRRELTGHTSAAMNDHYTHRTLESLRPAVKSMPGLTKQTARKK